MSHSFTRLIFHESYCSLNTFKLLFHALQQPSEFNQICQEIMLVFWTLYVVYSSNSTSGRTDVFKKKQEKTSLWLRLITAKARLANLSHCHYFWQVFYRYGCYSWWWRMHFVKSLKDHFDSQCIGCTSITFSIEIQGTNHITARIHTIILRRRLVADKKQTITLSSNCLQTGLLFSLDE